MAVTDYSTTPASNTSISGIDIGENCSPANINDALRQMMADVRAVYDLTSLKDADGKVEINPTVTSNSYHDDATAYALDMTNSDIIRINALYWSDESSSTTEGLMFPNTASPATTADWSSVRAYQSKLLFAPDASSTSHEVWHRGLTTSVAEAFLEGDDAPTTTNLNTLSVPGIYSFSSTDTGGPSGSYDSVVHHMESSGQQTQVLITGQDIIYHRVDDGSGYGSWSRIQTDNYNVKDTSADYAPGNTACPAPGGSITWSHGLGGLPSRVEAYFVFTGSLNGYSSGDWLPIATTMASGSRGWSIKMDSSTIEFVVQSPFFPHGTTGADADFRNQGSILKVTVRAWA